MYESFFGLAEKPFQLTPDPGFLFLSREHRRALIHLDYGIRENIGFILVTGEVGTGKTTLLKKVMREMDSDVTVARVTNTRVTADQLLAMINDDFGIETRGRRKSEMLRDLYEFIISQYAQKRRTTLIIDEAQNLTADLLEEIRLLSNLETEKSKLLQIVLVGQPELRRTLDRPEMRQLRQRISISCHINPLTREETEAYILHRLEMAGNRDAVNFLPGSLEAVCSFARGVPRLINIACDFILLTAFTLEKRDIDPELAREVIGDLEAGNRYWQDDDQAPLPPEPGRADSGVREIIDRLNSLEAVVHDSRTDPGTRDVLPGPSGFIMKAEPSGPSDTRQVDDVRIGQMSLELNSLRQRLAAFESRPAQAPPSYQHQPAPKSFWKRMLKKYSGNGSE